jgi:hypothetical protein
MSKFIKLEDSKGRICIIEGTEKPNSEFLIKRFICEINVQITKNETQEVTDLVLNALNNKEDVQPPKWEIERTDSYWYWSSRNGTSFVEITYWYDPINLERKETKRAVNNHYGDNYSLPDWAKAITDHRKHLDLG